MAVAVTAANLDDGAHALKLLCKLTEEKSPRLEVIFADHKDSNQTSKTQRMRTGWRPLLPSGFITTSMLTWMRSAAATHAWPGWCRRVTRDHNRNIFLRDLGEYRRHPIQQMLRRLKPTRISRG